MQKNPQTNALSFGQYPRVEGSRVVFAYDGPADVVSLKHWTNGLPSDVPFTLSSDGRRWFCEVRLPEGCRFEYKLAVHRDGQEHWMLDPLNPVSAPDPFGGNSVVHTHTYRSPHAVGESAVDRGGTIELLQCDRIDAGERIEVKVYLPSGYSPAQAYPLLVVHDGSDFLAFADFQQMLDNLIHLRLICPVVCGLIDPSDRNRQYADDPQHAQWVAQMLLPALQREYSIAPLPRRRVLMGASLGAVASLSVAFRYPQVFDQLILHSGSFDADPARVAGRPELEPAVRFIQQLAATGGRPAHRVFVSCGAHESLVPANRSLVALLISRGAEVRYEEVADGHHWKNWRDRIPGALSWLLPAAEE